MVIECISYAHRNILLFLFLLPHFIPSRARKDTKNVQAQENFSFLFFLCRGTEMKSDYKTTEPICSIRMTICNFTIIFLPLFSSLPDWGGRDFRIKCLSAESCLAFCNKKISLLRLLVHRTTEKCSGATKFIVKIILWLYRSVPGSGSRLNLRIAVSSLHALHNHFNIHDNAKMTIATRLLTIYTAPPLSSDLFIVKHEKSCKGRSDGWLIMHSMTANRRFFACSFSFEARNSRNFRVERISRHDKFHHFNSFFSTLSPPGKHCRECH